MRRLWIISSDKYKQMNQAVFWRPSIRKNRNRYVKILYITQISPEDRENRNEGSNQRYHATLRARNKI